MLYPMNEVTTPSFRRNPEQALAALGRLQDMLGRTGREAEVTETLRLVPGKRAVFRGTLDGREVVFRLPLDAANQRDFAAEWSELLRLHGYMSTPPFQVVEPFDFDPNTGIQVISYVPGTPLLKHLQKAGDGTRTALITQTAQWLGHYSEPTIQTTAIPHRRWHRKAGDAAAKQPHEALRDVEAHILRKMGKLGRRLADLTWRTAVTHGDFHLNNLILSGDSLVGIDIGGPGRLPIYKDMARALTHTARRATPLLRQAPFRRRCRRLRGLRHSLRSR